MMYYWLTRGARQTDLRGLTTQQRRQIAHVQRRLLKTAQWAQWMKLGQHLDSCAVSPIAWKHLERGHERL